MKKLFLLCLPFFFYFQTQAQSLAEPQLIVSQDRGYHHNFGSCMAISGNYAIVGAPYEGEQDTTAVFPSIIGNGAAYIFQLQAQGEWVEVQKLGEVERERGSQFGTAVAIAGKFAVVGVPNGRRDPNGGEDMVYAGTAFIYEREETGNWVLIQEVVASDRLWRDHFGESVAVFGETIFIGAPDKDVDGIPNVGAVYVFERNGSGKWDEVQKLVCEDKDRSDQFGNAISLDGKYALIGSYWEGKDAQERNEKKASGAAYIFEKTTSGKWEQTQKLVASDRAVDDTFGKTLSLSGDWAIIGAPQKGKTGGNEPFRFVGAAYIFHKSETGKWNQAQKIEASDLDKGDFFGVSVAIKDEYAIVGAHHESGIGPALFKAGAAYLFHQNEEGRWEEKEKITEPRRKNLNAFGFPVTLSDAHVFIGVPGKDEIPPAETSIYTRSAGAFYSYDLPGSGSQKKSLIAYPNPTSGILFIDLEAKYPKIRLSISDLTGRVVYQKFLCDISILKTVIPGGPGLYFIEILSPEGVVDNLKVLKQN